MLTWTKEKPIKEGWYFWRGTKATKDRRKWKTLFYDMRNDYFWGAGFMVLHPIGGWWAGPISEPEEMK